MPITILTNGASLSSQRRLSEVTRDLRSSFERLSSGLRINRAIDDAAGLAISSGLNADARVYAQGLRNVNDGASYLNIAQGGLHELSAITIRQIELAEQAANGVYSKSQREALEVEANALVREYNRIVQSISFNAQAIYGNAEALSGLRIQAGYGEDGGISMMLGSGLRRADGDGTFLASAAYTTGSSPTVSLGDLNGDGIQDLVSADYGSDSVSILIGNGNGTFRARHSFDIGPNPRDVRTVDVNGDGKLDVLGIAGTGATYALRVFLGNGDGTFKAQVSYTTASTVRALEVGDVNGDGILDAVASSAGSSVISVLLGNADGSFKARRNYDTGSDPRDLVSGDFNGDGRMDIATADYGGPTLSILLANADGSFSAPTIYPNVVNPRRVSAGDINGDGILDLVTTGQSNRLFVFLGNGDGSFLARRSFITSGDPREVVVSDLNADGIADLAISDSTDASVMIAIGNGNGTFLATTSYAMPSVGSTLNYGDLNGDDVGDLVLGGSTTVKVLLANTDYVFTARPLEFNTAADARNALTTLRKQLNRISSELGMIGAFQTRLEAAASNLSVARTNFAEAASRIVDVDVAEESAALARRRILQQAASSVLAQANQQPALALRLLESG